MKPDNPMLDAYLRQSPPQPSNTGLRRWVIFRTVRDGMGRAVVLRTAFHLHGCDTELVCDRVMN
jgi:hypothetical protein